MSNLVKFPSHILPARVTPKLLRTDEVIAGPLTNIQQVASRGNPAWSWTYEFVDLSEDERDVVQAFLMKCQGPVNTFKVTDPGDYGLKGAISDWIDIFQSRGSFTPDVGSSSTKISSWWSSDADLETHITDERILTQRWINRQLVNSPKWFGENNAGKVSSLDLGKAYVQRVKFFQDRQSRGVKFTFRVNSGSSGDYVQSAPATYVHSTDSITAPFYVGDDVSSYGAFIRNFVVNDSKIGDDWGYADYRLSRVVLVSNSENLLTQSNNFSHADWSPTNASVVSGYSDKDPFGVSSGGWRMNADASVNTLFTIRQAITKVNTGEIYTLSVYAKSDAYAEMALQLDNGASANRQRAVYNILSGSVISVDAAGDFGRPFAAVFSLSNGWKRLQLTGLANSESTIRPRIYLAEGGAISFTGTAGGNEIAAAQLRVFPFMGQYITTSDTAIVGTGWQTGSTLVVDGFDPGDLIKSGQRLEIVNRFYNVDTGVYERSEFKRLTSEMRANNEGQLTLEIEPGIRNPPVTDRSKIQNDHQGETMHNPVIFNQPEMKARLIQNSIQYTDKSLKSMDLTFTVLEDLTE